MVLSNAFNPDPRVYKEAKSLVDHGFKVTVYAWDRECRYPENEVVEGIYVKRVHVRSKYRNLLMLVITAPIFWLLASLRTISRDVEIIHCHDFDTAPVGVLVKVLTRNTSARFREIIEKYKEVAEYHGISPKILVNYPIVEVNHCKFNVENLTFTGMEDEETDDFRDYVRKWGLRFYSKRPFRSVFPQEDA